jgi:hypothetical protein
MKVFPSIINTFLNCIFEQKIQMVGRWVRLCGRLKKTTRMEHWTMGVKKIQGKLSGNQRTAGLAGRKSRAPL